MLDLEKPLQKGLPQVALDIIKSRDEKIATLKEEIATLKEENSALISLSKDQARRLEKYETPYAPTSTDSLYNKEKTAFRKKMTEDTGLPSHRPDLNQEKSDTTPSRTGKSHNNKASKTITINATVS